jgi:riboflavin kinase/FMN adenylyltransferase
VQPIPQPHVLVKTDRWTPAAPACAVTVGNFDGVHLGHAAIVRRLLAVARDRGMPAVAFTFDPHPASIVRPEAAPTPLSTPLRRAELLAALGVDAVLVQPTDRRFVALDARSFYADILRGRLHAAAIVEGPDFRFGAGRGGDIGLLASLAKSDGVTVEAVQAVAIDGLPVSSSRIRGLVAEGRLREAGRLLTQPYRLSGTVAVGAKRGGPMGFPTANLAGIATLLPATGVYAARASIAGDGASWPAAVHVGPNVSFGEQAISVEAHLIGFSGDLYGRTLDVDFLDRLRDTRRFASIDDLKAQLAVDVAHAAQVVRTSGNGNEPSGEA